MRNCNDGSNWGRNMKSIREANQAFGWQPNILLIADAGAQADVTAGLVTAAGARLVATVPLAGAVARLADQGPLDALVVEAGGAAPAEVARTIDAVVRFAEADDCAVVIAIDDTQIDLVGAAMLGGRYVLLCGADTGARLAAIAGSVARDNAIWLHDAGRDNEAARLRRLNDEVARIAETLARLTRNEPRADPFMASVADRGLAYRAEPDEAPVAAADLRRMIRARRLRDQYFGEGLFEDPAWDMLLDLYAAHLEHSQVSVSSLCIAAAVPSTTALRWIGRMSDAGLLERRPDPFDRRRAYMALSVTALAGMEGYFTALARAGGSMPA